MRSAREIFAVLPRKEGYQRVNANHALDLYCGFDELSRYTLLLKSESEPERVKSSKVIHVSLGKRGDGKWTLSFSLEDDIYKDMFIRFCDDMMTSSAFLKDVANGPAFICARYRCWQQMLSSAQGDLLSETEVKGLIGEMLFIRDYLLLTYEKEMVLRSWTGPKMASQDFVFTDTWYEVKAVSSHAEHVQISSVEQIDCAETGTLAVLILDKTSETDSNGIALNNLYHQLLNLIGDERLQLIFSNRLLEMGFYPRLEYDTCYRLREIRQYRVDAAFPCLRRADLPESVTGAVYTLSLAAISCYLKK